MKDQELIQKTGIKRCLSPLGISLRASKPYSFSSVQRFTERRVISKLEQGICGDRWRAAPWHI